MRGWTAPSEATELNLITRAQQGDRQAFDELVRRHRQGVINVVYRMCGDVNLEMTQLKLETSTGGEQSIEKGSQTALFP